MKLNTTNAVRRAFTLLEVMIAIAIFFVGSFAILGLVSSSLNNVRRLQRPTVDATPVLAVWSATNSLIEGHYNGSLSDENLLGKGYRDYNWDLEIVEIASLRVEGLMTVAPLESAARDAFAAVRNLKLTLSQAFPAVHFGVLSMGMSGDFESAIAEGATMVRIGTALFGPRTG